jgi:hypothetical protein
MSKSDLAAVDFGPGDLRTLEEIATQVSACKSASEKSGRSAHVLTVFLKMVDEKLSGFLKDLRERMKAGKVS